MKRIEAIVDGGMIGGNPGKGGWGGRFRIYDEDLVIDEKFFGESFGEEIVTNNVCEWRAVLGALIKFCEYYRGFMDYTIISDSKLVVMQVNNKWACKDDHLYQIKNVYDRIEVDLLGKPQVIHRRRAHTECAHDHIAKILGRSK